MKKKFFVLKAESQSKPARLEYYDNEKKWKLGTHPKRCIILKTCFNINRKLDTKHKHALALYTKDDCFTIILDNDDELDAWLRTLLELQQGDAEEESTEPLKPSFEHIWQVNVRNRGLASTKNILGSYHLCLTSQVLSLVKLNTEIPEITEFPLMSIRRCGHSYCFFFMELGRSAVTGAGELWMQTEDVIIAQNMHEAILNAMRSGAKDEIAPRPRTRSSSTNEGSKPIPVHMRRQTIVTAIIPGSRERSDSVPSRPRTISDNPSEFGNSPGSAQNSLNPSDISIESEEHEHLQFDFFPSHSLETCGSVTDNDLQSFDAYLPMTPPDTCTNKGLLKLNEHADDGYMDMASPSSLPPVGLFSRSRTPSATTSPNIGSTLTNSVGKGSSLSSQPDYLEMISPTSNSPAEPDGYMQMSSLGSSLPNVASKIPYLGKPHRTASARHNSTKCQLRTTVLDETRKPSLDETNAEEGYLPMAPLNGSLNSQMDGAYLEMSSMKTKDLNAGSFVTPNVDSANLRFSEFHLEKVTAYFSPNEEEEKLVRAYSVGSKTSALQNKNDASHLDESRTDLADSRVRAFSVGSKVGIRFGQKGIDRTTQQTATENKDKKSQSEPLLGAHRSWSGTSLLNVNSNKSKQNEDLMELDFARSPKSSCLLKNITMVKRNDDILSLPTTDWGMGSMRPRSNSRSNTCPSKGETLQVIGEKSDLNPGNEPTELVESDQLTKSSSKMVGLLHNDNSKPKNSCTASTWSDTQSPNFASAQSEQFSTQHLNPSMIEPPLTTAAYVNVDMNRQGHKKYSGIRSIASTPAKCLSTQVYSHSRVTANSVGSQSTDKNHKVNHKVIPPHHVQLGNEPIASPTALCNDLQNSETLETVKMATQLPFMQIINSITPKIPSQTKLIDESSLPSAIECASANLQDRDMNPAVINESFLKENKGQNNLQLRKVETPYENIVCCTNEFNSSRTASVCSNCKLNYASLDLTSTSSDNDTVSLVLHDKKCSNLDESNESEPHSYASIDFKKSEGLRHTSVMRDSIRD